GTAAVAPLVPADFAPLVGDRVALALRAKFKNGVVIDPLSIEAAAVRVTGDAAFGGPHRAVSAHLRADVPELARFANMIGQPLQGSAGLAVSIAGTEDRPRLDLHLSGEGVRLGASGAEHVEANVQAKPTASLDDRASRIDFAANGRVNGIVIPEGVT